MENKYQRGKIYKLVNDEMPNLVYYGSTIKTLQQRLSVHKCDSKKYNKSSKPLFEFGTPKIILVQNKPCNSKKELEKREAFYIRNFKCINKFIPLRTKKEWCLEYREDNKEKLNEKFDCKCGGRYTFKNKLQHLKTKLHQDYIS